MTIEELIKLKIEETQKELERVKLLLPNVSGQLKCHHQYMNAGTLQGEAMKKCLKCGDYVKAL